MIEHIEPGILPPNKKACIALTSWKKRIDSVGLTIFSIREMCGTKYHIVLTLSEDEFPQKERELPHDLVTMNKAGVVEILWVKHNYRSFKKVFWTAQKYPNVPIISADDGQVYTTNFADILIDFGRLHPNAICAWRKCTHNGLTMPVGCAGILYPRTFPFHLCVKVLSNQIYKTRHDDMFIGIIADIFDIPVLSYDPEGHNNFIVLPEAEQYGITLNEPHKDKKFEYLVKTTKKRIIALLS